MYNAIFILLRRMRTPLIVLIVAYALSILGLVLIPGVDGEGRPWRMGFFHAAYVISYTASTIGFGEIPHPFTDAQRLWMIFAIHITVVAWLFSIGKLLTIASDPAFQRVVAHARFVRSVNRLNEPFYVVCGYGDTGSLLVRALADHGIRSVVIDIDPNRIQALEIDELPLHVPGLCTDATDGSELLMAGLKHAKCVGVVAVTNSDQANLTVAVTSKLLVSGRVVICRAESPEAAANMRACGADHIVNPFESFAERLALAVESPALELMENWLTSTRSELLGGLISPPRGRWIVAGYGRFGRAVSAALAMEGMEIAVVEPNRDRAASEGPNVVGLATDAETLLRAGIQHAAGIIAGSDVDASNVAMIMTTRQLNAGLFTIARQNQRRNDAMFEAAQLDVVMQPGSMIAHRILAHILTPLLADFLAQARRQSNEWANTMVSRLRAVSDDHPPDTWITEVRSHAAPALWEAVASRREVQIRHLSVDPRNRESTLPCLALMVVRGSQQILAPEDSFPIQEGDRVLMSGLPEAQRNMTWTLRNPNVLHYVLTGIEKPSGYLWQRFAQ